MNLFNKAFLGFNKLLYFAIAALLLINSSGLTVLAQSATPSPTAEPTIVSTLTPTPEPTSGSKPEFDEERYKDLKEKIKELELKLSETRDRGRTLASEIAYMDNQIARTTLQINLLEQKIEDLIEEISQLSLKIDELEQALTDLSNILLNRIVETYKRGNSSPLELLLGAKSFGNFLLRFRYIKAAQASDKLLMFEVQETKDIFAEQKKTREEKKTQLEGLQQQLKVQKEQLKNQKAAKAFLLEQTKNDEKRYQQLLAAARAEFEAIQSIIAGKGDETSAGHVNEGQIIASIIQGSSCNSSGTHLHFIVRENGATLNPFSFLKGGIEYQNCSGSSCDSGDGDPFNPSGNWIWPLDPPIRLSQGYGSTWAVRNTWVGRVYSFHNGIDINGSSLEVKAVKSGTLYRGSYSGSGGCRLRYVRVDHDDSNLETLYLHVNY